MSNDVVGTTFFMLDDSYSCWMYLISGLISCNILYYSKSSVLQHTWIAQFFGVTECS